MMTRFLAATFAWCLCGISATAITILPMTFGELVDASTAVVYGRVADVRGQWTSNRHGIDSVLTIDAIQYLKGDLTGRVTVRVPGGRVGEMVHVIPGAPVLAEGDLVVLFLKASGPAMPTPAGLTQGVFRVTVDPATHAPLVQPPVLHTAGTGRIVRGDAARRPMTIAALGAQVRDAMKDAR